MALPYAWTTINVGDKVLYNDHMTDVRGNADYLNNNVENRTYYAPKNTSLLSGVDSGFDVSVYSTQDVGYLGVYDLAADNPNYTSMNSGRDVTECSGVNSAADGTLNSGVHPSYNTGVYTGHDLTVYPAYNRVCNTM